MQVIPASVTERISGGFRHYRPADAVRALAQDAAGFLWLGTDAGLGRFDGDTFTFSFDDDRLRGPVHALLSASDGALFVGLGNEGGLLRWHGDRLQAFASGKTVNAIIERASGDVLAATTEGIIAVRASSGMHTETLLTDLVATSFAIAPDGTVWAATDAGAVALDSPRSQRMTGVPITALQVDAHGTFWFGTRGRGLFRQRADEPEAVLVRTMEEEVGAIALGPDGAVFVGTAVFMLRIRADGGHDSFLIDAGLPVPPIRSLLVDREGAVWIGTEASGLARRPSRRLIEPFGRAEGLAGDVPFSVTVGTGGEVFVSSTLGLTRWMAGRSLATWHAAGPVRLHDLRSLALDEATGVLWMGTLGQGLIAWSPGATRRYGRREGLDSDGLRAPWRDSRGDRWFALEGGGGITRLHEGRFETFRPSGPACRGQVYDIAEGDGRELWLAGEGGLCAFREGRFDLRWTVPDGGTIWSLLHDEDGFWLATSAGLAYQPERGLVRPLGVTDGVPPGPVHQIVRDRRGGLWLGGVRGLVRLDRDAALAVARGRSANKLTAHTLTIADGLRSNQTIRGTNPTVATTPDGRLWFATLSGIAIIDPTALDADPEPGRPVITAVELDGRSWEPSRGLRAPVGRGRLQLHYTVPAFSAANRLRFRYRLEGYESQWNVAEGRRIAIYTGVPAGSYVFAVAASLEGVPALGAEERLPIVLVAPLITPRVVWMAFFALLILLAIVAHRLHLWQERRRFAAVLAERNRIARELHDNLEQNLIGIKLHLEAAAGAPAIDESRAYLQRATDAARSLKAQVRTSVWALRSHLLAKATLATALPASASTWLRGSPVKLDHQESGVRFDLDDATENNLLSIAQEAVTNVLKHAGASRIELRLRWQRDGLAMEISDDGRGLSEGDLSTRGLGIVGMRERAAALGGRASIRPREGGGTTVEVTIPRPRRGWFAWLRKRGAS